MEATNKSSPPRNCVTLVTVWEVVEKVFVVFVVMLLVMDVDVPDEEVLVVKVLLLEVAVKVVPVVPFRMGFGLTRIQGASWQG